MNLILVSDKEFIRILSDIIKANISDENFGVRELAVASGLSQSYIRRRLKKIACKSVSRFICEIRLLQAELLILESDRTAAEAAYQVGFGSANYFYKCFHEYYGFPVSELKKRSISDDSNDIEPAEHEKVVTSERIAPRGTIHTRQSLLKASHKNLILISSGVFALVLIYLIFRGFITSGINSERRTTADKSILVLPFKNFTGNPANQYFADGLTEEILNSLFLISDIRVLSRTTSDHFSDTDLTAGEIAAEVNARNVLEGSIRQEGDKIRISIQLIDGNRDLHIWSSNFDRDINNILGTQGEIAIQVAKILNGIINEDEEKSITETLTRNPEAYDNYLKGRFLLHQSTNEQRADINRKGLSLALQHFEKAVAADTSFVEAYAGLAYTWFNISAWKYLPVREGFQKARDLSRIALQLDQNCAEAHAVLGAYYIWGERKFEDGHKELMTALRLNPNYTSTNQWYTQLLMITGPLEEARLHMDRTLELEPYFWVNHSLNAWIYYFEEKYDRAIEACENAYDLNPDFQTNYWLFFLNFAKLKEGDKALEKLLQITHRSYNSDRFDEEIKTAYENEGIKGLFKWLVEANLNNPVASEGLSGHPFFLAWWYAVLGESEKSIYWLGKNMEAKNKLYEYSNLIANNPDFDLLRNDSRFLEILDQLGLTPYHSRKSR